MWDLSSDTTIAVLATEFMALANHRKPIRAEIARFGKKFRDMRVEVLSRVLTEHGVDLDELPPVSLAVLLETLARGLVLEAGLGISNGHAETRALVERYIKLMTAIATIRNPTEEKA